MKVGGWLSAKDALDWGFVDEITDLEDEPASASVRRARHCYGFRGYAPLTSLFIFIPLIPMPEPKTYTEEEYNALNQQLTETNALADSQKKTIEERDATSHGYSYSDLQRIEKFSSIY